MLRQLIIVAAIIVSSCNNGEQANKIEKEDSAGVNDSVPMDISNDSSKSAIVDLESKDKIYANQRFRNVTVEKIDEHKFIIKGEAQVFEASLSWVVEDGHEQLKKGFEMTEAGAPAWGKFNFTVDVSKKRSNSTLHLILFEASAKDGTPQFELPVLLY